MKRYKCIECSLIYDDKKIAKWCQDWCREHKSCNLEITKYALNKNEKGGEKMKTHKICLAFSILFLFALSAVSAQQYGMMDSNGQFYRYGIMGGNNQFYPVNSGYSGLMGGGGGMMGM